MKGCPCIRDYTASDGILERSSIKSKSHGICASFNYEEGRFTGITSSGWRVPVRTSLECELSREGPKTQGSRMFHLSEAFNLYFSCSTSQRIMDGICSCAGYTLERPGASMVSSHPDYRQICLPIFAVGSLKNIWAVSRCAVLPYLCDIVPHQGSSLVSSLQKKKNSQIFHFPRAALGPKAAVSCFQRTLWPDWVISPWGHARLLEVWNFFFPLN